MMKSRVKALRNALSLMTGISLGVAAVAVAHDDEHDEANASSFELAMGNDGASSLPVFNGPFPATENMVFLGQVAPDDLGAKPVPGVWAKGMMNDIWGWTSPNGEEYALAPNSGGIAIVRVTDPANPEFMGKIESQSPGSFQNIWGDAATFGHYAYFVSEIEQSQIVIVDLSGLDALEAAETPDDLLPAPIDYWSGGGYLSSHNIFINTASGFAYLAGVGLDAGGNACGNSSPADFNTLILDLNATPDNPTVVACIDDAGEHDFYVVNYTGPDPDYQGSEIAFVFDGRDREGQATNNPVGGKTFIWDVTDKANIVEIASFRVPGLVFSHNGWTTEEQDFLFIGDEIDELVLAGWAFSAFFTQPVAEPTNKPQTGTYVLDIKDLDNPVFHSRFTDGTVGLDHNLMVEGDKLYIASYTSGTRVIQINRDAQGDVSLEPIARMDTEPRLQKNILNIKQAEKFSSAFLGQWGIYAFPTSDTVIASDVNNGLIVMRLSDEPCRGIKCSK
jgi:choice-of-anchor B domain-containing protein